MAPDHSRAVRRDQSGSGVEAMTEAGLAVAIILILLWFVIMD
jgi:hypothetical protein